MLIPTIFLIGGTILSVYVNLSCELILMGVDDQTTFFSASDNTNNSEKIGLFKYYNTTANECSSYADTLNNIDFFDFEQFDPYFKSARAMAIIASTIGGLIALITLCSCCASCNSAGSSCSCLGMLAFIACAAQGLVFLIYQSNNCTENDDGVLGVKNISLRITHGS